jgi:ubiquinone/menaquinone biosynthesis C-methylase UbiE
VLKRTDDARRTTVSVPEPGEVEKTLQAPGVHQQWEDYYRTAENERFYELAFDYIVSILQAPRNSTFLDAGCGSGSHSLRLAKRGFSVLAVDFSASALKTAERNLQSSDLRESIKLQREDVVSLSFADGAFDYVLCWGVLMHIPDVEKALSELTRVLKSGGGLVISEGNMYSLQSMILRSLKLLLRREKATVRKTPAGLEYWTLTPSGRLLTRQANVGWLMKELRSRGFTVEKRVSGQFAELYTRFSSRWLRNVVHGFNYWWFKHTKIPHLAFGNILIAQKKSRYP